MASKSNNGGFGRYAGRKNSKTPTGNRPRPQVAKSELPTPQLPGATRKAIPRFKMPTPNRNKATRAGKRNGGS